MAPAVCAINKKGYVALFGVIIIGALALVIGLSFMAWALNSTKSSRDYNSSQQAKALANACAEQALLEISNSTSYTGSTTLTIGSGQCTYVVSNLGGSNRQINASGTINSVTRRAKILIDQVSPSINITSWEELADF